MKKGRTSKSVNVPQAYAFGGWAGTASTFGQRQVPLDWQLLQEYAANGVVRACVDLNAKAVADVGRHVYRQARPASVPRSKRVGRATLRHLRSKAYIRGAADVAVAQVDDHPLADVLRRAEVEFQFSFLTSVYLDVLASRERWPSTSSPGRSGCPMPRRSTLSGIPFGCRTGTTIRRWRGNHMDRIRKSYETELQVNKGKREVLAIISTAAIDRDGEVVRPDGLKRRNFAGNPVVLVNHDYASLPVGKCLWVKPDGDRVLAKYAVSDKTQLARDVWGLLQDGVLGARSIGFRSLRASAPTTAEKRADAKLENARLVHREWELLEFSIVGVPANPEALTLAVSKGLGAEVRQILDGNGGVVPPPVEVEGADRVGDLSPDAIHRAAERVRSIRVDRLVSAAARSVQ